MRYFSWILFIGLGMFVAVQPLNSNLSSLCILSVVYNDNASCLSAKSADASPYLEGIIALTYNPTQAENYFYAALNTPISPLASTKLIELWSHRGEWNHVLTHLQVTPTVEHAYITQLALQRLPHTQEPETTMWRQALKLHSSDALLLYAYELYSTQHFSDTAIWADTIEDSSIFYWEAQFLVGRSQFYLQQYERASVTFKQIYNSTPINGEIAFWYGRALLFAGDPQQAIKPLEQAVQMEKGLISAWYLDDLAKSYAAVKRCDEARKAIDVALQRNHENEIQKRLNSTLFMLSTCP